MGKHTVWTDDIGDKAIEVSAEKNGIDPNIVARMVDDAFRIAKQVMRGKTYPDVSIGGWFLLKPSFTKIKTRILRLATNMTPRNLEQIESLEEIIQREDYLKSGITKKEKYLEATKWDKRLAESQNKKLKL